MFQHLEYGVKLEALAREVEKQIAHLHMEIDERAEKINSESFRVFKLTK